MTIKIKHAHTHWNDQVTAPTVHTASTQRRSRSMLMIIIHENDQMAKSRSINRYVYKYTKPPCTCRQAAIADSVVLCLFFLWIYIVSEIEYGCYGWRGVPTMLHLLWHLNALQILINTPFFDHLHSAQCCVVCMSESFTSHRIYWK